MARLNESPAYLRGLQAEESFSKLLGDKVSKAGTMTDRIDHWDFMVKFDVKRIRGTDEFGDSNYHWVELMNVNGNTGWLYGKADYFAFETKDYWITVAADDLREFIDKKVTNTEVTFKREPYRVYRREGRLDKVVQVSTLDLCFIGFMYKK